MKSDKALMLAGLLCTQLLLHPFSAMASNFRDGVLEDGPAPKKSAQVKPKQAPVGSPHMEEDFGNALKTLEKGVGKPSGISARAVTTKALKILPLAAVIPLAASMSNDAQATPISELAKGAAAK